MARTTLITGATDGIGLELARIYGDRGDTLALVGRREFATLDRPPFEAASYCCTDLSRAGCAEQVVAHLEERGIDSLDLLILNAGVGYHGPIPDQSPESIHELVAVNLLAPMALVHSLHSRVARAGGKIVLVSSIVSALPCPDFAVYAATKAALDGFARSLRVELGVRRVQLIHPGATRSGMHEKVGLSREVVDWERFPPAATVAAAIGRAIHGRRDQVTIGMGNRVLRFIGSFLAAPLDRIQMGLARRRARCAS